jgi:ABC-type multidrug transport system fused ATPase/permease subunit
MWQKIKSLFKKNDKPPIPINWSLYGRVWQECGRPHWKWLAAGIVCTIIAASAEAWAITLVKKIADKGIMDKDMMALYVAGLSVVAAYTTKSVFGYAQTLTMAKAGLLGITGLRRRMYQHTVKQPISFFHDSQTGTLMNYFTGLANAVLTLVTECVITIVQSTVTLLFMLGVMLWCAPQMMLVLLFLAPGVLIPLVIIIRKLRAVVHISIAADAKSLSHINQSILGVKTIQSFGTEEKESKNMGAIEDTRIRAAFKSIKLTGLQTPLLEIMISIGLCLALIAGGTLIQNGAMTPGDFMMFLLALVVIYKPAKSLTSIGGKIQTGLIAAEKLFAFLDRDSEIADAPDAETLESAPMKVELDHISFAYNDKDGNVLHDVSLVIKPGTLCAFVGPSGGGKSTVFNLLGRFYDPQQGNVLINGTDIRRLTLESLRRNIAAVSQDVFLFDGTIADNIKYGSPDVTQEQIIAAAKAANAHEFIMGFPDRYDNHVGERGTLLSGGQKQRVAIARAILKDAPILLLDEATSALDSESEQQIQSALKELMCGRTTFVIAHRLATVLDAAIICVIKEGRIVEKGTDNELYALGGEYKKLKDIQFSDGES